MMKNVRENVVSTGSALFADLYHLTMAQAWFFSKKENEIKTSEAFFRKCPFGGSYLMTAGLKEFSQWLDNWGFNSDDIKYLKTLKNADGNPKFKKEFLDFLSKQKLQLTIKCVKEGEVVFPNEPVYSVSGPCWQVDMVEAALLNIFNSQSLIATKASRMALACKSDGIERPLLEFGVRRGQELGGLSASRASFIGGAVGTSNIVAGKNFGIPVSGTMAHSFIMSFENELDAFKKYMKSSVGNTILLVDTYDTREGIKNAIKASLETGIKLMGMRIDSGDLAYWAKEAKKIIETEAKKTKKSYLFKDAKLIASNDLDEYAIENLVAIQKAPFDIMAAGTKLVTAYDTPALGGVFKTKSYMGEPKIKIAEGKTTIPGATNVVRIIKNNKFDGDVIVRCDDNVVEDQKLNRDLISYKIGSLNGDKKIIKKGTEARVLLDYLMIDGKFVNIPESDLNIIQAYGKENLNKLDNSHKRLSNPHIYGVGLENSLFSLQQNLINLYTGR
ncbi:MAG: nicotinate phosphoribosyltransferase [Alphaproteobacteria bacterium]|nr:nicotinate phosphoribosyltransferase [Alphaproteobacteria bacterium]